MTTTVCFFGRTADIIRLAFTAKLASQASLETQLPVFLVHLSEICRAYVTLEAVWNQFVELMDVFAKYVKILFRILL